MQVPSYAGVQRSKRPLSACHTRFIYSMEASGNSVEGSNLITKLSLVTKA